MGLTDGRLEKIRTDVERARRNMEGDRREAVVPSEVRKWVLAAGDLLAEVDRLRPRRAEGAVRLLSRNPGPEVVQVVAGLLSPDDPPLGFDLTWDVERVKHGTVKVEVGGLDPKLRFEEVGAPDYVIQKLRERRQRFGRV
jgi:hypothetical protein